MECLKLISYNIWFEETDWQDRLDQLVVHIDRYKPSIILLQEVRPEVQERILLLLSNKYPYHTPNRISGSYGDMILSQFKILEHFNLPYANSNMGRKLLVSKIEFPQNLVMGDNDWSVEYVPVIIATSHFESIFTKSVNKEKTQQYEDVREFLEGLATFVPNMIFAGDTNALLNEEKLFLSSSLWTDAWTVEKGRNEQYTYDAYKNKYLSRTDYRSRFDQVHFRGPNLVYKKFNLIKGSKDREASDHFGIYAEIKLIE